MRTTYSSSMAALLLCSILVTNSITTIVVVWIDDSYCWVTALILSGCRHRALSCVVVVFAVVVHQISTVFQAFLLGLESSRGLH